LIIQKNKNQIEHDKNKAFNTINNYNLEGKNQNKLNSNKDLSNESNNNQLENLNNSNLKNKLKNNDFSEIQLSLDLEKTERYLNEKDKSLGFEGKIDFKNQSERNNQGKNGLKLSKEKIDYVNHKNETKLKEFIKNESISKNFFQKLSFWELIKGNICSNKLKNEDLQKRHKFYRLYQRELSKYIEINKIIDMQTNILLLKNIILNESQEEALNYYQSYFVPEDYNKNQEERIRLEKLKGLSEYYNNNINVTGKIHKIDKKIFENLNEELRAIFKE